MSAPSATTAAPRQLSLERVLGRWLPAALRHALLVFFVAAVLMPLLWIAFSSIKSVSEQYRVPATFIPREPTLEWYAFVISKVPLLPVYYANSLTVALVSTLGTVAIACLAGYSFGRLDFWGRDRVFWGLIVTMFLPTSITSLFATYELIDFLGLLDTQLGLILPYTATGMIFSTFIMRSVFMSIPAELEDAARIDGAGPLQTFLRVMLPLAANGIVVVFILSFVNHWGEYLLARTLTTQKAITLPVAIAGFQPQSGEWYFSTMTAAYLLMFGPAFVVLVAVQRWFMKGLTEGALKF
ncbi:MAG TPA: carbohydrate ABC transporter permease [Chloroflexota bacterium]|jgi:ABC-type glycerol-3-phosphate transport system permease component|nr:carbohydrate ABC transporter permease [Chloroflexota bacterium]